MRHCGCRIVGSQSRATHGQSALAFSGQAGSKLDTHHSQHRAADAHSLGIGFGFQRPQTGSDSKFGEGVKSARGAIAIVAAATTRETWLERPLAPTIANRLLHSKQQKECINGLSTIAIIASHELLHELLGQKQLLRRHPLTWRSKKSSSLRHWGVSVKSFILVNTKNCHCSGAKHRRLWVCKCWAQAIV